MSYPSEPNDCIGPFTCDLCRPRVQRDDVEKLTRMLVGLCTRLCAVSDERVAKHIIAEVCGGELSAWLAERVESSERERSRIRASAIAKLTPEELEALGVKP